MSNTPKQYVFSGYSDNLEDLTFGDEFLDENRTNGEDLPEEWITTCVDEHTKH